MSLLHYSLLTITNLENDLPISKHFDIDLHFDYVESNGKHVNWLVALVRHNVIACQYITFNRSIAVITHSITTIQLLG